MEDGRGRGQRGDGRRGWFTRSALLFWSSSLCPHAPIPLYFYAPFNFFMLLHGTSRLPCHFFTTRSFPSHPFHFSHTPHMPPPRLPVHPRIGKMLLLGTFFNCLSPLLIVAASSSLSRDPFISPMASRDAADAARRAFASGMGRAATASWHWLHNACIASATTRHVASSKHAVSYGSLSGWAGWFVRLPKSYPFWNWVTIKPTLKIKNAAKTA